MNKKATHIFIFLIAEATVEGMQTTISQIREDPVYYL